MPRAAPLLNNTSAGELSPLMEGRADFPKYQNGCRTLENWIPTVHGPAQKRPGTRYVATARNPAEAQRLIEFEFSTEQVYVLAFNDEFLRVFRDGSMIVALGTAITGVTQASPAVVTSASHGLSNGDRVFLQDVGGMVELQNREFIVAASMTNTFQITDTVGVPVDSSAYGAYTSGGTANAIFEVAIPYAAADLDALSFAQSADVLYLAHPDYAPRKVERTADDAWTITEIAFTGGSPARWPPFGQENDTTIAISANAADLGAVTLTASAALFTSEDVGRRIKLSVNLAEEYALWVAAQAGGLDPNEENYFEGNLYRRVSGTPRGRTPPVHREHLQREYDGDAGTGNVLWEYRHSGSGYVDITGFTNSTTVTGTITRELPSAIHVGGSIYDRTAAATKKWAFGAWDEVNGYPCSVTFHDDRLWWGGSAGQPQGLWASRPGDFENHEVTDDDEGALFLVLNTDKINAVRWMYSDQQLLFGTTGGEFATRVPNDEAITGQNARAPRNSSFGVQPNARVVGAEEAILFVQRGGRKVRELLFNFDTDQFEGRDLTVLSEHITRGRIKWSAYAQEPDRVVWFITEDGKLLGLTYQRAQDVVAWHRQLLGGTDVAVESIATIPRSDGSDELWLSVTRTIEGVTTRHIEYLLPEWEEGSDIEDAEFMDSSLTRDSTASVTVTGLWHLNGETVQVLADGFVQASKVVTNGSITLASAGSKVTAGLGFVSRYESMKIEAGAADGTSQGRNQSVRNLVLRLYQAGAGLEYGPDFTSMDELKLRDDSVPLDTPVPLFDGDTERLAWPGGTTRGERIALRHSQPLPCTVVAALPIVSTEDK